MDFVDFLSECGISCRMEGQHTRPGWVQFDCPYCDGPLYMGFNTFGKYLNCWRCGPKPVLHTLGKLTGKPYHELKAVMGNLSAGKAIERDAGYLQTPRGVDNMLAAHRRYLRGRGYSPRVIERLWGVQGIGIAARLQWRLFIPIHFQGRVVSWTTRSIADDVPTRYISAKLSEESVPHKTLLYGEDYCNRHTIIVVEGPFDVWRIGPGAVACLGVGYSRAQVNRLTKYSTRVICFDNQPKAQRRASQLCDLLAPFEGETYNVVLSGKDAGETPEEEIEELRKRFL